MKIFGILNVTPDSFSDGAANVNAAVAEKHAREMVAAGAQIIDIGAESTRPGATTISSEEELNRLFPILELIADLALSIDTRNYETAKEVLKFSNVKFLNDVSGFSDHRMIELAAKKNVNIIAMHSLTVPADPNVILTGDLFETIKIWIDKKFEQLTSAGIPRHKITFDPGLGFGKSTEQSLKLINHAEELANFCHERGAKIFYGHSRKSFLGVESIANRDAKTAEHSNYLQKYGVDYIRVHNVALNRAALIP